MELPKPLLFIGDLTPLQCTGGTGTWHGDAKARSITQVRWNTQGRYDPDLWEDRKLLLLLEQPMLQIQGHWDGNLAVTSCKCPWQGRSCVCPSLRAAASGRALPTMPALPNKDASEEFLFSSSLPLHSGCWMLKDKAAKPSQSPVPSEQDPQAPTSPWMSARFKCKFSGWFIRDQTVPLPRGSSTSSPLR